MNSAPQISVIINNYNYAKFLEKAIGSALDQGGVSAEVIVVDDGSTDDSEQVIRSFGDRIRPVFQRNGGQAQAINTGVETAKAPLLAFLDADDWWPTDKLARVVQAFEENPEAGLVYHRLQPVFSDGQHAFSAIPRTLCTGDLAKRLLSSGGRWPFPMTSSLSIRRDVWDRAGKIPETFRISADAWIAGVLPLIAPVVALPDALGYYRIHNNAWYRKHDDAKMLARRMDHWEDSVRITNLFLSQEGRSERINLKDHFDYRAGQFRLRRPGAPGTLSLIWHGLTDAGEPNPVRRLRDTLFLFNDIRRDWLHGRNDPDAVKDKTV
jgi:glycosyltransferase involved in cell wall biosynthesis